MVLLSCSQHAEGGGTTLDLKVSMNDIFIRCKKALLSFPNEVSFFCFMYSVVALVKSTRRIYIICRSKICRIPYRSGPDYSCTGWIVQRKSFIAKAVGWKHVSKCLHIGQPHVCLPSLLQEHCVAINVDKFSISNAIFYQQVTYPSGAVVKIGERLSKDQIKEEPLVDWPCEEDALYTLYMQSMLPTKISNFSKCLTLGDSTMKSR